MSKKVLLPIYVQFSIRKNFNKFDSVAKSFKSMLLSLTFQSGSVEWTFFKSPLCLLILCNDCWNIYYTKYLQISLKFTNYNITVLNNLKQELRFKCSGKNAFELAIYIRDSLVSWTLMLALCKHCQKQLLDASTATSFKYLQHQFIKFIYIYKFQMVHYIKYYIICILNI